MHSLGRQAIEHLKGFMHDWQDSCNGISENFPLFVWLECLIPRLGKGGRKKEVISPFSPKEVVK